MRRHVELGVVGEHAHRVARPELGTDLLEVAVGPLVDDVVGHREALAGGEHRAGVAHHDAVPEHLRDLGQRAGEVDRAEDHHPRRRRERLDEHRHRVFARFAVRAVVTGGREAGGELADRVARDDAVEVGVAEGAHGGAAGLDEELGADVRAGGDRGQHDRPFGPQQVAEVLVDRRFGHGATSRAVRRRGGWCRRT